MNNGWCPKCQKLTIQIDQKIGRRTIVVCQSCGTTLSSRSTNMVSEGTSIPALLKDVQDCYAKFKFLLDQSDEKVKGAYLLRDYLYLEVVIADLKRLEKS